MCLYGYLCKYNTLEYFTDSVQSRKRDSYLVTGSKFKKTSNALYHYIKYHMWKQTAMATNNTYELSLG